MNFRRTAYLILLPGLALFPGTGWLAGVAWAQTLTRADTGTSSGIALPQPPQDSTLAQRFKQRNVVKVTDLCSPDRDNNPIISADGHILFFNSTRYANRPWATYDSLEGRYDEDIYFSVRRSDKQFEEVWSHPVNLGPFINSRGDDGVVGLSPDGQTIYFNSLKYGWEYDGGPFYSADIHGTQWTYVQGLGGGITDFFASRDKSKRFKVYGAAVSSDANDFYFATTAYSRDGNHELWVSHKGSNGEWGWPQNLGPVVNSGSGSYAPFLASDNKTLFFSSKRPDGYGGDDIYMTVLKNGEWSVPQNVGFPINSIEDESFLSLTASGQRLYLSSSRDGNDDIYTVPAPDVLRPINVILLSGCVTDKKNGAPIEASVAIEDLMTGSRMFSVGSNSATGEYLLVLQPGRTYGITISAPGYVFVSDFFKIPIGERYQEYTRDFHLKKLREGGSFVVNNMFFEYNSAKIMPESISEMNRLVNLLNDNPDIRIEVGGHTDSIGSERYNRMLSLKRANAVKEYLVKTGKIDKLRITTWGYGPNLPIADNTTEEGRRKNRRIEFSVIIPPDE